MHEFKILFVKDFFQDENVIKYVQKMSKNGVWNSLGM